LESDQAARPGLDVICVVGRALEHRLERFCVGLDAFQAVGREFFISPFHAFGEKGTGRTASGAIGDVVNPVVVFLVFLIGIEGMQLTMMDEKIFHRLFRHFCGSPRRVRPLADLALDFVDAKPFRPGTELPKRFLMLEYFQVERQFLDNAAVLAVFGVVRHFSLSFQVFEI
jgi:hypothetical protein